MQNVWMWNVRIEHGKMNLWECFDRMLRRFWVHCRLHGIGGEFHLLIEEPKQTEHPLPNGITSLSAIVVGDATSIPTAIMIRRWICSECKSAEKLTSVRKIKRSPCCGVRLACCVNIRMTNWQVEKCGKVFTFYFNIRYYTTRGQHLLENPTAVARVHFSK